MSDLTEFRDHCRAMADPNPPSKPIGPYCRPWGHLPADHDRCAQKDPARLCGCACHSSNAPVPEPDRRLWAALADEIDEHLREDDDGPGLFDTEGEL
jgi:hypothetical protein